MVLTTSQLPGSLGSRLVTREFGKKEVIYFGER
jgi:hypothetical protein